MSDFLALLQVLVGAASLGIALLALESGRPPNIGGPSQKDED